MWMNLNQILFFEFSNYAKILMASDKHMKYSLLYLNCRQGDKSEL